VIVGGVEVSGFTVAEDVGILETGLKRLREAAAVSPKLLPRRSSSTELRAGSLS
jgi:hypothetical protein